VQKSVALLTPTYYKDYDRFALLCDSIDRRVTGHEHHYAVVVEADMPLFARFSGERRTILSASRFLPRGLKLLPALRMRHGRRIWWSFRSGLVHGWHIQQILKCAAAATLPQQRYVVLDSDNVFIRDFDATAYAGAEMTPLYYDPASIAADTPMHGEWTRNCQKLLGLAPIGFPADDYIGHAIVWDQQTVRDMLARIELVTKRPWIEALCVTRAFSEYLLYGNFVRATPAHSGAHRPTTRSLVASYWDSAPLDAEGLTRFIAAASPEAVAVSAPSFSKTPLSLLRDAAQLSPTSLRDVALCDTLA